MSSTKATAGTKSQKEDTPLTSKFSTSQTTPSATSTCTDKQQHISKTTSATKANVTVASSAVKTPAPTLSGMKRPAAAPSSSSSSILSPAARRRPYRRTKKPKGYCDKSTVTTTTDAAMTPVNVYDAVLGEAEDLLTAAMEAQAMGRLKMASAYQLLSHARLVGLGKRFDRAHVLPEPTLDQDDDAPEEVTSSSPLTTAVDAKRAAESSALTPKQQENDQQQGDDDDNDDATDTTDGDKDKQHPVTELARLLPSNIEMDTIMMEHLARAAVELHHQRTGRKISADGLLASPMNGFLAAAMQPSPLRTIRANETDDAADHSSNSVNNNKSSVKQNGGTTAAGAAVAAPGVAWTEEEKSKLQQAQRDGITDPAEIAKLVTTRNEAQVKAYLRNISELEKGTAAVEQDFGGDGEEATPRKRGGRGRKPPTTAMNTVPNAKLNARSLLQGKGLD